MIGILPPIWGDPCPTACLSTVRPLAGNRARGWLTAGSFRVPCALGAAGIVRIKREGDKGTPGGAVQAAVGLLPARPRAAEERRRAAEAYAPRPGLVRGPGKRALQSPGPPARRQTARTGCGATITSTISIFVLDQNFSRRSKGRGSAIFFHLARAGFTPTAGCVAISAPDMLKLAPRLKLAARRWRSGSRRRGVHVPMMTSDRS